MTTPLQAPSPIKVLPSVQNLSKLDLSRVPPNLEVPSNSISFEMVSQATSFEDQNAFKTPFNDDTKSIAEMAALVATGNKFISALYSYRGCSKALPMVQQDTTEEVRIEIHRKTFQILRPEIQKMKEFMDFHEHAVRVFGQNLLTLVKPEQKKMVHSEAKLDLLLQIIDMLVLLDSLKDMKAGILNDFSRYKRAFTSIRTELNDSDVISEEIHTLQMFFGNPQHPKNLIIFHLKSDIHRISGFEDVLALLLTHCTDTLEQERYLFAREKHMFLRVIPYLIYLMDADEPEGLNVFKSKKIDLGQIQKALKYYPTLPIYGDMKIDVTFILQQCKHWNEEMANKWQSSKPAKIARHYELKYHREAIREQYNTFTAQLASVLNEMRNARDTNQPVTPEMLQTVFRVVVQGIKLINQWNARVMEQSAYKFSNPISEERFIELGGKNSKSKEYEKAMKYNHSPEELYALVDVIGMIKGLGGLIMKSSTDFLPYLRQAIHDDLQDFVQTELARPLRKAMKRKKPVKDTMLIIRDIAGDWLNLEAQEDYKQTKKEILSLNRDFPRRAVAPTNSQIQLVRRIMHSIFSPRAPGMQGGLFSEPDLKKEWLDAWEEFYRKSFYYPYLLNFNETLFESVDMSHLWYREFNLEITDCVQFPIGMSMPWILTEFVVKTPSINENIFFPMDIYNDAAHRALSILGQQYLYDEVEAEVNLAFDQLVFNLSEEIFKYYKGVATNFLLDKPLGVAYSKIKRGAITNVNSRFETLMAQRHVQILGRSVDLKILISQHVNGYLRRNLDYVISRFESNDLTSVIEFESLFMNARYTHFLLSRFLNIDPFEDMFNEINEDTSVGQFRGRIVVHVFSELISDLLPNFVYNTTTNRFIRGPVTYVDPPVRESPPKNVPIYFWFKKSLKDVIEKGFDLTKGFFGVEHMESLLRVLDHSDLPLVISECLNSLDYQVNSVLSEYSRVMLEALQPMKLPQLQYGVIGAFGFFQLKLKPLFDYGPLRPAVFQSLRELGNTLAFLQMLEGTSHQMNNFKFQLDSFYLGIQQVSGEGVDPFTRPSGPSPLASIGTAVVDVLPRNDQKDQFSKLKTTVEEIDHLHTNILKKTSLFAAVLQRLEKILDKSVRATWTGTEAPNGIVDVEAPRDFCRLWSSLQFIFCSSQKAESKEEDHVPDIDMFGDGWLWAGCTILHLLGLRERFEYLDFCYHIMNLNQLVPAPTQIEKKKGAALTPDQALIPVVQAFLREMVYVKNMNEVIFEALDSYIPAPAKVLKTVSPDEKSAPLLRAGTRPIHAPNVSMQFSTPSTSMGSHNHTPSIPESPSDPIPTGAPPPPPIPSHGPPPPPIPSHGPPPPPPPR